MAICERVTPTTETKRYVDKTSTWDFTKSRFVLSMPHPQRQRDGSRLFITSTIIFATEWFIVTSLEQMIGRFAMMKVAAILPTIYTIMFEECPYRVVWRSTDNSAGGGALPKGRKIPQGTRKFFPPLVEWVRSIGLQRLNTIRTSISRYGLTILRRWFATPMRSPVIASIRSCGSRKNGNRSETSKVASLIRRYGS